MPPDIKGYRDLTADEIELINQIKQSAVLVGNVVQTLRDSTDLDQRWVSIGATDLQTGFMALVRAVAQPETF